MNRLLSILIIYPASGFPQFGELHSCVAAGSVCGIFNFTAGIKVLQNPTGRLIISLAPVPAFFEVGNNYV